jgi:hypothetical protein
MKSYHHYSAKKESFESFVADVINKLIKVKIKPKTLEKIINPYFDNIFCIDKYEVFFRSTQYEDPLDIIYEFDVNKIPIEPKLRFGCELETCFDITCKGVKIPDNFQSLSWIDQVVYHIKTNLTPFLSKKFLNRFPYAYISDVHNNYKHDSNYVDMSTGKIISSLLTDIDLYSTLVFTQDISIECEEFYHIPCEIVTPVLSDISELKLLFEGIITPTCTKTNKSAGFHVNVSGIDQDGKIIKLTQSMIVNLIHKWLPYEKVHYTKLRGEEGSQYAIRLENVINNPSNLTYLNMLVKNKRNTPIKISDIYEPYGLNDWLVYKFLSNEKYYSITNHKQNNIIEFRIFPSSDNISDLLSYTKDALNIFKKSISSGHKLSIDLQRTYLKYEFRREITFPDKLVFYSQDFFILQLMNINMLWKIYKYSKTFFGGEKLNIRYFVDIHDCDGYNVILYTGSWHNPEYIYSYKINVVKNERQVEISIINPQPITVEEFNKIKKQPYED